MTHRDEGAIEKIKEFCQQFEIILHKRFFHNNKLVEGSISDRKSIVNFINVLKLLKWSTTKYYDFQLWSGIIDICEKRDNFSFKIPKDKELFSEIISIREKMNLSSKSHRKRDWVLEFEKIIEPRIKTGNFDVVGYWQKRKRKPYFIQPHNRGFKKRMYRIPENKEVIFNIGTARY